MKYSEKEIIDALNVIKDVCNDSGCNHNCPFHNDLFCVIQNVTPEVWSVADYRPTFKALK